MEVQQAEQVIDEILNLYQRYGKADYIGEQISQIEHMSQSASLAIENEFDDELILAAFFHDIGHICVARNEENSLAGFGSRRHEQIGADFLRKAGFPDRVAQLVEMHVQAKRYLVSSQPSYYEALSEASRETLRMQGGPMTKEEAKTFEQHPLFYESLVLRRWDEMAKQSGVPLIDLAIIRTIAVDLLIGIAKSI